MVRTALKVASLRQLLGLASRHGMMPATVRCHLPVVGETVFRVSGCGSGFRYLLRPGDTIGTQLFWGGWQAWEPETVSVFSMLVRDAKHFVDVGANTGLFSLLACALNPTVRVTAFEPVPTTASILRSNIALSGWQQRCAVEQAAVADAVGAAEFNVPPGVAPDMASLGADGWLGVKGETLTVTTTTIDAAIGPDEPPDLIKIDVEGHEDKVLAGAKGTLAEERPLVVVECNPEGPFAAVDRLLREHSYEVYHLRLDGVRLVQSVKPDERNDPLRGRNFLAVPSEQELTVLSRWIQPGNTGPAIGEES